MPAALISLSERLDPGPAILLDGGLATQLEAAGADLSDDLWSARLLADCPDEVTAAHRAYYAAGAEIAITASYQASFTGFARRGLDSAATAVLLRRSVELACQARDQAAGDGRARWVAASVGPYGATLADGSEYRGRYGLSAARLRDFHLPRLEILASAGPDLLAIETIPDVDEAAVLVEALSDIGIAAWLSFTIAGSHTRAGQPLADAFELASSSDQVLAVGINCCSPADVVPALNVLASVTAKPGVAYPNSGEEWDAASRGWRPGRSGPLRPADWVAAGARLIGGCCRTTPADIKSFRSALTVDG